VLRNGFWRRGLRVVVLAVAILALTAGVAVATTLVSNAYEDAAGVYHGCVNGTNGNLRVATPSETCKNNEVAIDWNQTGPQGAKGDAGPAGAVGAPGPAGPAGAAGLAGATGAQGLKGENGPAGAQGPKGETGAKGDTGPAGAEGPKGEMGAAGADGHEGPKGDTGAAGPVGPAGPTGADGKPGDQGPQGIVGPEGPAGPAGADGAEIASLDSLQGKACNESQPEKGTVQVTYAPTTGAISLVCKATAYRTLTITVSGRLSIPHYSTYSYSCGFLQTCYGTNTYYTYQPQSVTGTPGISCWANDDGSPKTCLYSIPTGTAITLNAGYGQQWSGTTSFTLDSDTTRSLSG
jgi:Collagen triple helix repeat (20 copies)